jgi:DNA-binding SARP family transcriptional activator/predicted ATPase/Tfp pilus assembly protein PilF
VNKTQGQARPDVTLGEAPYVQLMGPPMLHGDGRTVPMPAERRFQLLALLALSEGRWVSRERIAGLLWPDLPPDQGRRNLRKVIFRLHGLPGLAALEVAEHGLRWPVRTDVGLLLQEQDAQTSDALSSGTGRLLDGLDDGANPAWSEWLAVERERAMQGWRRAALAQMARLADTPQRVALAHRMLLVDPLDEAALVVLIQAAKAAGQDTHAQRLFSEYAQRLAEALGVEPSLALRRLLEQASADTTAAAMETAPVLKDERFIGRKAELAEFRAMLSRPECRQVTILGPGGIGKSSFARRVLALVAPQFPGLAHWVELQDLRDEPELLARLVQMLGIEVGDTQDRTLAIGRVLGEQAALFVLDNAEHLEGLPALVDRLLAAAPGLRLVLTSRSRLNGTHEWLLPLQGLAVPDEDSRDLETAGTFDAVRLFEARAALARRDFSLARHLRAVIEITEAVAGMPLAIELAAHWVRLLPPEEIVRELRRSLDVLERDPALSDAPQRPEHRSMRAVLKRGWQWLAPSEQAAMARLSVFAGGFTAAAARQVADVPMPLLSALSDKSMLAADEHGRIGMHPLVAAYAAQVLLGDPAAAAAVQTRHAEHFARHLVGLVPHATGDQRLLVAGVDAEYANCATAWRRAVQQLRADLVYDMARTLWGFFEIRSRYREGIELLSPALALPEHLEASPRALTRLRHGLSMLHFRKGDPEQARSLARDGIGPGEGCGDTEAYIGCLLNTAMCLWAHGNAAEARPYYDKGLSVARQRHDRHCIVWAQGSIAVCLQAQGELDEAQAMMTDSLAGARHLGDHYITACNLNNLGHLLTSRGQWAEAQSILEEGLHHCRSFGIVSAELYMATGMAQALMARGMLGRARATLATALQKCQDVGMHEVEWALQILLVDIQIRTGELASAPARLAQFVSRARAQRLGRLANMTVELHGDLMLAQGLPAQAAAAWRALLTQAGVSALHRQRIAEKLRQAEASMGADGTPPATVTFEDLLDLIARG